MIGDRLAGSEGSRLSRSELARTAGSTEESIDELVAAGVLPPGDGDTHMERR